MKKQGSGEELESRKLTDDELKQVESIVSENSELDPEYLAAFYPELSPRMIKEVMKSYQKKSPVPKAKATTKAAKTSAAAADCPFSADDFKAWYHWDMVSDPKNEAALRVRKELIKKLGPSAYRKYEDQMTDSYTSRGHTKAYNSLPELIAARKEAYNANLQAKTAKAQKAVAEMAGATEAAAKHGERAKVESAKLKAAKERIDGVASKAPSASKPDEEKTPIRKETKKTIKKSMTFEEIDKFKGDPRTLSPKERQAWAIMHGYHQSEDEPKLRKLKSLAGLWQYLDAQTKARKDARMKDIKAKGFTPVRTAIGVFWAKKGSRKVYNSDGQEADSKGTEYARAKLAGRKPRQLKYV
jgi:ribosomal protein L12E/L44/L45/RPP1/RPP2